MPANLSKALYLSSIQYCESSCLLLVLRLSLRLGVFVLLFIHLCFGLAAVYIAPRFHFLSISFLPLSFLFA